MDISYLTGLQFMNRPVPKTIDIFPCWTYKGRTIRKLMGSGTFSACGDFFHVHWLHRISFLGQVPCTNFFLFFIGWWGGDGFFGSPQGHNTTQFLFWNNNLSKNTIIFSRTQKSLRAHNRLFENTTKFSRTIKSFSNHN